MPELWHTRPRPLPPYAPRARGRGPRRACVACPKRHARCGGRGVPACPQAGFAYVAVAISHRNEGPFGFGCSAAAEGRLHNRTPRRQGPGPHLKTQLRRPRCPTGACAALQFTGGMRPICAPLQEIPRALKNTGRLKGRCHPQMLTMPNVVPALETTLTLAGVLFSEQRTTYPLNKSL